jgi:hypothetical protein
MLITAEYNLIPHPGHDYQVQAYTPDRPIANQQRQQGPVDGPALLKQSHSKISAPTCRFDRPDNLYDFKLFLQYPAFDQIGRIVDIYA